jgi:hypothetical protein
LLGLLHTIQDPTLNDDRFASLSVVRSALTTIAEIIKLSGPGIAKSVKNLMEIRILFHNYLVEADKRITKALFYTERPYKVEQLICNMSLCTVTLNFMHHFGSYCAEVVTCDSPSITISFYCKTEGYL